jgi:hypothetical protein
MGGRSAKDSAAEIPSSRASSLLHAMYRLGDSTVSEHAADVSVEARSVGASLLANWSAHPLKIQRLKYRLREQAHSYMRCVSSEIARCQRTPQMYLLKHGVWERACSRMGGTCAKDSAAGIPSSRASSLLRAMYRLGDSTVSEHAADISVAARSVGASLLANGRHILKIQRLKYLLREQAHSYMDLTG